ncbi:MAG: hypothetical protein H7Y36_04060, partial [Armatimonadetes bacterium]|nr:hypothetical protein [Akkermansiaceae bacterium]
MLKTFSAVVSVICLLCGSLNAQGSKTSEPKVRALLLAPGGPTMDLFTLDIKTGKVSGPGLVGARGISDPFTPGALAFSFAIEDKSKENGYRPVADVTLPPEGKDFIVLLEPNGETFKTHLVRGKAPRFGNSATMFFIATDVPIGVTLGDNKVVVLPRKPSLGE